MDGGYTVFGEVVKGLEVIEAIANVKRDENNRPLKRPKNVNKNIPIMLEKAQEYLKEGFFSPKDEKELESFRIRFLSKKGIMNDLLRPSKRYPTNRRKHLVRY